MTRFSQFNSPFLLGFDQLERVLDRVAKSGNDAYPPYNIEQVDEDRLRITLAVAGFGEDELAVTIEDNQLVIRGKQAEDAERTFLHRGIAARQFQRAFVLADGIEVLQAQLENGLLSIELQRPRPASSVKRVAINGGTGRKKDGGPVRLEPGGNHKRA